MRIHTHGNSRPHIVHPGYQHASRHSSRWERQEPLLNFWIIAAPALLVGLGLAILEIVR